MNFDEKIKKLESDEIQTFNIGINDISDRKTFASSLKTIMSLFDPNKNPKGVRTVFNRESLRRFLKDPANAKNNQSLRDLSNYLYTISHVYRRMINYKAEQVNCKVWNAYPIVNMVEPNDATQVLSEYNRVVNIVQAMNMESQIGKMTKQVWKNGVSFGFIYGNPEKNGNFYIHLLDPALCRIDRVSWDSGVLGFSYDFSSFNGNEEKLEYYDKVFTKLYNEFQRDNIKWKELPIERTICLKMDTDQLEYSIPPLSGLLESIISITDLQAAQDEIDSLQNYKMIWGKLNTIKGSNMADDFEVDLDLALEFMKKVNEVLPDNVAYALSPLDLDTIEFKDNDSADTNVLAKAYSNLIEANGSIVLNSNKITNSTAFKLAVAVEAIDAMSLVPQINAWMKFFLKYNHKVETIVVEFSQVSPYFIDEEIEKYTKLAGLGLPVKTELASMVNSNPQKSFGMDYLERELLKLGIDRWTNPLVSSNTQSADASEKNGAPKKDDGELTDEGVDTRDRDKNDK